MGYQISYRQRFICDGCQRFDSVPERASIGSRYCLFAVVQLVEIDRQSGTARRQPGKKDEASPRFQVIQCLLIGGGIADGHNADIEKDVGRREDAAGSPGAGGVRIDHRREGPSASCRTA